MTPQEEIELVLNDPRNDYEPIPTWAARWLHRIGENLPTPKEND